MIQNLIVGVIVVLAGLYALWILLPDAARRRAAAWLASLASRCGLAEENTRRLHATLATHSSCSECAGCKGCASAVKKKIAAPQ
jgi:hypothetical protein